MRVIQHPKLRTRLVLLVLLAVLPALGLILYSAGVEQQSARTAVGLLIVTILSMAVAWWGGDRWLVRPVNALLCVTEKLR
ncbi:MAG: hypothetical protein ACREP5_15790, partial [Candidatus Binatia bacterium]